MRVIKKLLPLLFLLLLIFAFSNLPKLIRIDSIECISQYGPCEENINKIFSEYTNQSLYEIKKQVKNQITDLILIEDYLVQYKIPNKVQIHILLKKARFSLYSLEHQSHFLVDVNGYVVGIYPETNLPFIEVEKKPPNVSEKVGESELNALYLIENVFYTYNVKSGKIKDGNLEVRLSSGFTVIFPLDKDRQVLLGALKIIMNRLNSEGTESRIIDGKPISIIDLRFANPVLR